MSEQENAAVADTAEAKASRKKFTPEQIAEIRSLRAEQDENGKPVYSHAKLAEQFGTKAGVISHIVRNLSYKDENYTPVNDGARA